MSSQQIPDRDSFLNAARIWAEAEYAVRYERPKRARETAKAWVDVIKVSVMSGVKNYASASAHKRYDRPRGEVIAAAPEISIDGLGYSAQWLDEGNDFYLIDEHKAVVIEQLGDVEFRPDEDERGCSVVTLSEPRVRITWTQLGTLFPDPRYTPAATFRLIKADGSEHGASPLESAIFAAFPTKGEADAWVHKRIAELTSEHDSNHNRKRIEFEARHRSRSA